jgi:hypothetical protein
MRETMSVWPSLVEGDRRFLPNPKKISGNYSMVPPETKRDAEPPLCNAADRDYGGEETTVPPAQPQRVKRHELDLTAERPGQGVFHNSHDNPWGPYNTPKPTNSQKDVVLPRTRSAVETNSNFPALYYMVSCNGGVARRLRCRGVFEKLLAANEGM